MWRRIQRQNFLHWSQLAEYLQLSEEQCTAILQHCAKFPLNLPYRLAAKIVKSDLQDPILMQFLPNIKELEHHPHFHDQPVQDNIFQTTPKLLQKYQSRALITTTSGCAMHCRYCFRRNFDYSPQKGYDTEVAAIKNDKNLQEIILSGGDPLSLSNTNLIDLINQLEAIDHIKRIRFHSRFIIGIPERIDEELLNCLKKCQKQIWFVIHCNHPRELDADILHAIKKLQLLGIPVLNQAVLLKGINDSLSVLKELSEELANNGIIFYYLHQLDRVRGTAHFEVPEERGLALIAQLTKTLSGYAIPKYVKEICGQASKTAL